jgi:glutamine amidotransferase
MATSSAITPVNNHPFVFGRHTIMHNGRITDFATVGRQMEGLMSAAAYKHMLGRTDSESFAALYMTYLCAGNGNNDGGEAWEKDYSLDEMLEALQFAANSVIELQVKALGENARANDLNVCVTDGERLVAMRFRNHERQQPPSLYYSTTAGVTMNRKYPDHPDGAACAHGPARGRKHGVEVKQEGEGANAEAGGGIGPGHNPFAQKRPEEHGRHVIVASEPTTYNAKEWELIEKNHAVLVEDGRVRVQQLTRIEGVGCGK